jgi:hypothetical protein
VKSIGNFISLTGETNSSVSNSSFAKKRDAYAEVNASDAVQAHSPNHWKNINDWSPDIVEARANEISSRLIQLLA